MRRPRWVAAAITLLVLATGGTLAAFLTGGSGHSTARALTAEQAQRFALARFSLYRQGRVAVAIRISQVGGDLKIESTVDFPHGHGLGTFTTAKHIEPTSYGAIAWTNSVFGIVTGARPATGTDQPPPTLPAAAWQAQPYQKQPLDTMLQLVLLLGQDRPDNAQLLQQSDAQWIGQTRIGAIAVDEFRGPSAGSLPNANGPTAPPTGASPTASAPTARSASAGTASTAGGHLTYYVDRQGRLWRVDIAGGAFPLGAEVDLHPTGPPARMGTGPFTS